MDYYYYGKAGAMHIVVKGKSFFEFVGFCELQQQGCEARTFRLTRTKTSPLSLSCFPTFCAKVPFAITRIVLCIAHLAN